jgi:pimeloyl-ACP methyl ester carboxylesterase
MSPMDAMTPNTATSRFVTAQDGMKLHVRDYGPHGGAVVPVVCLPGLARSGADFEELATALSTDPRWARRVFAIDARGRGRSDYDPDPAKYNLAVELGDVLAVITALGIGRAVFVGTSRGGILTMLLGVARPAALAGCVLNDIGPQIETPGVMRIKGYVGKLPLPASFQDAAAILRRTFGSQFPKLGEQDWMRWARRTYREAGGHLVPDYDVSLGTALGEVDLDKPLPSLWKEFDALAHVPVMVVRGANSDILSAATVAEMQARHAGLKVIEVPDQGHAPLLAEPDVIGRIAALVAECDAPPSAIS